ncbi:MAG: DUF2285 domain-containing protein [Rhodospirillaceae bacterium]|nr:DUF2285 domain-containing protein [Rhodospirillaceae bacterium]
MSARNSLFDSVAWQDAAAYQWTLALPRLAWAWEFLRRNPAYRAAWREARRSRRVTRLAPRLTVIETDETAADAGEWCLLPPLEDPGRDVRHAAVFWDAADCPTVLPVFAASGDARGGRSPLFRSKYKCRIAVYVAPDGRQHVLFTHHGRSVQLEVAGLSIFAAKQLLAAVAPPHDRFSSHVHAMKRLADLMIHNDLRPQLYPTYAQSRRLAEVLQALDGWLQGATQRRIATALFGKERADHMWRHQRRHMLDRVRRAIKRGRALMNGGYRRFLK